MNIVELNTVSKAFRSEIVLNNIDLKIRRAERLVILGPSGCGKTTILRLIAGFTAPDRGSVRIDGRIAASDGRIIIPPEERKLGMVFQDLALWPHLTVRGNIEFGLKATGIGHYEMSKRVNDIVAMVGMTRFIDRKPAELSGGQRQRVALARSIVLNPKLLLMDEALSSLDPELSLHLRKELLRLQQDLGFTLLYVTHNHEEAAEIATRTITMRQCGVFRDNDHIKTQPA